MKLSSPYESIYLKYQNHENLAQEIQKYVLIDYEYIKDKEHKQIESFVGEGSTLHPVILYGLTSTEDTIASFNHPIISEKNNFIAIDARVLVKPDTQTLSYEVRNDSEYNLLLQRLILSGLWKIGKESDMYALKFAHFAFGSWISENLTKRFALDLNDQIRVKIVAYLYYAHLFSNEFTEDDFSKLKIRLAEDIYALNTVDEIYEDTKDMYTSIDGFCKACYKATNNSRLQGFSVDVFINIIANNWLSINGKELVILSLEHPPTWISIIYASLTLKSFKRNYITTIVEKINKKDKGNDFLKSYVFLTKSYLKE